MSHLFLISIILLHSGFSAESYAQSAATKEETIQWLTTKISQVYCHSKAGGSISVNNSVITISSSGYGSTNIDLNKIHDYKLTLCSVFWSEAYPGTNYVLEFSCSGCGYSTYSGKYQDGIQMTIKLDNAMKDRFIKALERLKELSKDNKEKF